LYILEFVVRTGTICDPSSIHPSTIHLSIYDLSTIHLSIYDPSSASAEAHFKVCVNPAEGGGGGGGEGFIDKQRMNVGRLAHHARKRRRRRRRRRRKDYSKLTQ